MARGGNACDIYAVWKYYAMLVQDGSLYIHIHRDIKDCF